MSRIGKKTIPLASGVKVAIGQQLEVTGPKGKLTVPIRPASASCRRAPRSRFIGPATNMPRCTV